MSEKHTVKSVSISGLLQFEPYGFGATLNGKPLDVLLREELDVPLATGEVRSGAVQLTVTYQDRDE